MSLPEARPLVVDEAYYEYAGETALDRIDDGVIVLRTFSKAFHHPGDVEQRDTRRQRDRRERIPHRDG
jgi:hypothetical protein